MSDLRALARAALGTGPAEGGVHEPFFRRLRRSGRDPKPFRGRRTRAYLVVGLLLLGALVAAGLLRPATGGLVVRLATLLSLTFLLATVGLWLGMRGRAFPVAAVLVVVLYAATGWFVALHVPDIFAVSVLVGFGLFALAGVYLVLVFEEMVYDTHRMLHLRHPAWATLPTFAAVALAVALPWWASQGGPGLAATSAAALASSILLASWWFLRAFNEVKREGLVLRELHLLVVSALAAALLADGLRLLREVGGLVPGFIGYGILLGTWVYVSYTTLQRTHFLLPARDPVAWLSLMLAASFAILAHSQFLYQAEGAGALGRLVELRIHYLITGVWIGIGLLVVRGLLRAGRLLGAAARTARAQSLAGGAKRVTQRIVATEEALGGAAVALYRGIERAIPGDHQGPTSPTFGRGWELEDGAVRPLDDAPPGADQSNVGRRTRRWRRPR